MVPNLWVEAGSSKRMVCAQDHSEHATLLQEVVEQANT